MGILTVWLCTRFGVTRASLDVYSILVCMAFPEVILVPIARNRNELQQYRACAWNASPILLT